jgi:hypothetical protein
MEVTLHLVVKTKTKQYLIMIIFFLMVTEQLQVSVSQVIAGLNSISLFPVVALNINKLMVRQCAQLCALADHSLLIIAGYLKGFFGWVLTVMALPDTLLPLYKCCIPFHHQSA